MTFLFCFPFYSSILYCDWIRFSFKESCSVYCLVAFYAMCLLLMHFFFDVFTDAPLDRRKRKNLYSVSLTINVRSWFMFKFDLIGSWLFTYRNANIDRHMHMVFHVQGFWLNYCSLSGSELSTEMAKLTRIEIQLVAFCLPINYEIFSVICIF